MSNNWEKQVREDLHNAEKEVAAQDLFRLAQARNNALHGKRSRHAKLLWPTLGVSLASVMLFAFFWGPTAFVGETSTVPTREVVSDEIFFDESLDLYEDLDFYYWLSESENGATG